VHVARLRMFYDVVAIMKPQPLRSRLRNLYIGSSDSESLKAEKYRWEFLRRNPKFVADYNGFMDSIGPWLKRKGPWGGLGTDTENWAKSNKKYFHAKIEPVLTELCRKWQVREIFPPELDWEEALLASQREDQRMLPPSWFPVDENGDSRKIRELKEMGFMGKGQMTKVCENHLLIQFDLNSPMKDLWEYAKGILSSAQRTYRKEMEKQGVKLPRGRRRFNDYQLHLRVWDLKHEGKSNAETAKSIFPKYSRDSALSRVRDHLKAANKLISGHYREIR
jgi:hypothetical protein